MKISQGIGLILSILLVVLFGLSWYLFFRVSTKVPETTPEPETDYFKDVKVVPIDKD